MLNRCLFSIIKGPPLVSAVDAAYFACFRVRSTSSQPQMGDEITPESFFLRGSGSVFCLQISRHIWQGQKSIIEPHNLQKGTDGRSRAKNL